MPSPTTITEFLELVRKSCVADEKRLSAYLEKVRAAQIMPSDPCKLAGLLVRDGVLTHFQAEQFLQGKWRRFNIGKYKVLEKLGAGGMGNVFLCEHKLMRRRVAIKVLPAQKTDDNSSLERFFREARAVAALDHPNIVRAYDIDQDENLHFLVMEHVDGSSLQEIVKKSGPLAVLRACHYVRQAALGLQHAHETAGIVHRDIKPGNVLVDRNGIVKILDMGLARFFHDEEDVLTKKYDENVLGTADYLAPEQALDSHSVDIRADIYSLGATFYYCLTGRTPFTDGTVAQKLIWHQTRQPKPVRQLRPEVPEGVLAVLDKMLAKDPNQRYRTPAEVAEALIPWTNAPIPPPPENEMPQLCPAAMGAQSSETIASMGPRTPSSGTQPLSSTRKTWQVPPSSTPAPATSPPPSSAPSREIRKPNPPNGPLNAQQPETILAVSSPGVAVLSPPTRVPAASSPPLKAPGSAALEIAPLRAPIVKGEAWSEVAAENGNGVAPRAARNGPVSLTPRVGGLPPTNSSRHVGGIVGLASVGAIALILVGFAVAWMFGDSSKSPTPGNAGAVVYYVNSRGENGAAPTIAEALRRIPRKNKQPTRIVVQDDVAENDLLIEVPNVILEAAEGKTIYWRPSAKPGASKLFTIHKAEGVSIKGLILDGDNRVDLLVNLFHRCPGVKLENLELRGFKKYGIWVTNCEGGESQEQRIQLRSLTFETTSSEQTAVFFSIEPGARDLIPKNRFFVFDSCTFRGPGTKIVADDRSALEHVELPDGVEPIQRAGSKSGR